MEMFEKEEIKLLLFTTYWGQSFETPNSSGTVCYRLLENWNYYKDRSKLVLKSMDNILLGDVMGMGFINIEQFNRLKTQFGYHSNEIDTLRALGYLLPFMDMSEDDLIKDGWVRLK